jgi:hypothetical protein
MYLFGSENVNERDHSEDPEVDGKVILRHILKGVEKTGTIGGLL